TYPISIAPFGGAMAPLPPTFAWRRAANGTIRPDGSRRITSHRFEPAVVAARPIGRPGAGRLQGALAMRASLIPLVLGATLMTTSAWAFDAYDSKGLFANEMFRPAPPARESNGSYEPNDSRNCIGTEWDEKHPLTLAKVTASPRVNFVKSPYDDEFKAATCPAATDACRKKSYLVTGDLVLVGRTQGDFTCVAYQQPAPRRPSFTEGWLPRTALTHVAPATSTAVTDWIGTWEHPHGTIEIKGGGIGGRPPNEGFLLGSTGPDFFKRAVLGPVMAAEDLNAVIEAGWKPIEKDFERRAQGRTRGIGPYLRVEDNGGCGGAGVSFTGLYRRK